MAISAIHDSQEFSVGDMIRVSQKISEGEKTRTQVFEGMVIGIKGKGVGKSFTVRRIGSAQVGIEKIFPLATPTIEKITVVKKGGRGIRQAKIYFVRTKSKKEINKIYSRTSRKQEKSPESKKESGKIKNATNPKATAGSKVRKPSKANSSKKGLQNN